MFLLSPLVLSRYLVFILNLLAIYALVSIGLNFVTGYTGQISVGHAGFLALGAYFTAIVATKAPYLPFYVILPMAGCFAGLIGFLLGIPILRLRGFYIAMATLAFGVVISQIALEWRGLTHGDEGFKVTSAFIGSFVFDSDKKLFYLVQPFAIVLILAAHNIVSTRVGRAFVAVRDSENVAQTLGINLSWSKTSAFALSAFYAGFAGGLFAYVVSHITPDSFSLTISIDFIAMIVIGGMGSILGSIIGAVILTGIQQLLGSLPEIQMLIFGVSLIIFMIFMPRGISGVISSLATATRAGKRLSSEQEAGEKGA
jgi:branched-chain amino acid transport system permease protein